MVVSHCMLIDTHAHLHTEAFDVDRDEVIARSLAANPILINVGFEPDGNEKAAQLAAQHLGVYWTAGIHPHSADLATPVALARIEELAASPIGKKLVALGEMGLDYFKNKQPKEVQVQAFAAQLQLAQKLNLPVIVHCRDAFDDAMRILSEEKITRAVFHCFTGMLQEAVRAWEAGYHTSFTGICTFPSAHTIRDVIAHAPADKIMIETDCPYLAPQGHRGERNEPAYLREILKTIAQAKKVPSDKIEQQIEKNTRVFFSL